MDEKTKLTIRAWTYVVYTAVAMVLTAVLSDMTIRVVLGGVAIYCLVMAVVNFRKSGKNDIERK